MGRPTNGRTKNVDVRLTEEEASILRERADAAGENVSAYVRRRALAGAILPDAQRGMAGETARIIRALNGVGVELHEIARLHEIGDAREPLDACLREVRAAILRLSV